MLHFKTENTPFFLKKSFLISQAHGEAALIVPWLEETLCHVQTKKGLLTLIPPVSIAPALQTALSFR